MKRARRKTDRDESRDQTNRRGQNQYCREAIHMISTRTGAEVGIKDERMEQVRYNKERNTTNNKMTCRRKISRKGLFWKVK